ncbi:MAG: hypothetical protein IJ037_13040 [Clostridia bacterium]|nr:hypothetical protein [Clostridia bacterium]MBQ8370427.1 hypothetical protein [Clostridia bacterium]MBQ8512682.1 hypothetical protein [Clostridia bacterium]
MNRLTRAASMLLAAITVAGSAVSAVSAADVIKFLPGIKDYNECEICESLIWGDEDYVKLSGKYYHTECREDEEDDDDKHVYLPSCKPLKPTYEYVTTYVPVQEGSNLYVESDKKLVIATKPVVTVKPGTVVKPSYTVIPGTTTILGGKYYTSEEAREYFSDYFEDNTYSITLRSGDTRTFDSGAYFISSDPEVAYYDYKEGKIVAGTHGSAELYVCSSAGIPYFCIKVNVLTRLTDSKKEAAYLKVDASAWQLSKGETATLTVTGSDGKTYDDINYTVRFGEENATVGKKTGVVTANGNGPVVVRAYSKSNPNLYGEALLFVGSYKNYVYDGYWTTTNDGIIVNGWGTTDVVIDYYSYIAGWIKVEDDGPMIPVIKKIDAINEKGEDTQIITGELLSYTDLLKQAYGDKDDIVDILKKYNLYKNGISEDKVTVNDIDWDKIVLGQIFKAING